MTVDEAKAALDAARKLLQAHELEVRLEKVRVTAEVVARFSNQTADLTESVRAAEERLRAAKDALPDHPWTGKRVYREEKQYARFSSRVTGVERIEGVVEMRRTGTVLPGGQLWGLPQLGEAFVRLAKKDGSLGLKVEDLERRHRHDQWRLVKEEPQP